MTVEHGTKPDIAAAQDASRSPANEELNAIQVLYKQPTDPAAFRDYLYNIHVPLVRKIPGVQYIIAQIGLTGMDQLPGEVFMIGTVVFGSEADLQSGLASEEGQAAYADVSMFATGGFTGYLSHVEFLEQP